MNDFDYEARFDRMIMLAGLLMEEPLSEMREVVSRAETIGPFIDPTKWIHGRGAQNIEEQRQVLDALIAAQVALFEIPALKAAFDLQKQQRECEAVGGERS